ncbi:MAG TPA: HlyD family efflux transporter periplasmic adaptor subunit [Clostridiales bacterium]|nr:HlyD family efflux transporter periplasmic adaptor subunit [Clostridiales bacterium]
MKFLNRNKRDGLTHDETEAKGAGGEGLAFFEGDRGKACDTASKSAEESLAVAESVALTGVTVAKTRKRRLDFRQRFRKNPKGLLFCGAAVLVFMLAAATAALLYLDNDAEDAVSYETVAVTTRTIDRTLTAAGEITYADPETVSFSTSKTLKATCVETDDAVVTGQKLAEYSNGTYLTADCNGVIAEINAPETGATATSSHYITIYPTDELILDITVPQDEINMVAKGDEADIVVNADKNTVYEGTITYLSGAASRSLSSDTSSETTESSVGGSEAAASANSNGSSGTSTDNNNTAYFEVIISMVNDGNLKLGMGANCTIMLESKEDVIAVPVEAVYFSAADRYVYLVGDDGSITKQTVETGISDAHYVEITAGLSGDETVRVEKIG